VATCFSLSILKSSGNQPMPKCVCRAAPPKGAMYDVRWMEPCLNINLQQIGLREVRARGRGYGPTRLLDGSEVKLQSQLHDTVTDLARRGSE